MSNRRLPWQGRVLIAWDSSLRKRMRAIRRGKLDLPAIAVKQPERYLHAHARYRRKVLLAG